MSDDGTTTDSHGHTPPEASDVVAPGVGTRLARSAIDAILGTATDDLPDAARRRVRFTIDAVRAHAADSSIDDASVDGGAPR